QVLHDLPPAENTLGLACEEVEEPELRGRQREGFAVARDGVPGGVQLETSDATHPSASRPVELTAPQDRADAPDQLGQREGLRAGSVGADPQAQNSVPGSPGSMRSRMTRSKLFVRAASNPESPSSRTSTSNPSWRSA